MLVVAVERSALLRRARPTLRWRYAVFIVFAFAYAVPQIDRQISDWPWFVIGAELLFHDDYPTLEPGGLSLFANHPFIQIGPLALLEVELFRIFGDGRVAAVLTTTAMGPALIYLVERIARRMRGVMQETEELAFLITVFIGGLLFTQAWVSLSAFYTHPDDGLVLALVTVGIWTIVAGKQRWLGVLLGLALGAKPWAIIATPLILVLHGRDRWRAAVLCGLIAAAAWLPFILADPETLTAMKPFAVTEAASVIGAIFQMPNPAPDWLRPVQMTLAVVVGCIAVWRGRWPAVLAVGVAIRLLLDPGVNTYYTSGLLLGTLVWDLARPAPPAPVWTAASFWLLGAMTTAVPSAVGEAILRLLLCVGLVLSVLLPSRRPTEAAVPRRRPFARSHQ